MVLNTMNLIWSHGKTRKEKFCFPVPTGVLGPIRIKCQGPSLSLRLLSHTHTIGGGLIPTSTCSKWCVHGTQLCEELTRRSVVRSGIAVLYLCLKIYILEREGIIYFMSTVLPLCACVWFWVAYSVAAQYMTASRCVCDTMKLCVHPREGTDTLIMGGAIDLVSVVFRVFCVAVKLCAGEISVSFDSFTIVVIFSRQNQSLVDLFLDTLLAYILNGNTNIFVTGFIHRHAPQLDFVL